MLCGSMSQHIPELSGTGVVVAGDVMLDRYWSGPVQRISPEAPVPVVRVRGISEQPGGAGNVAMNLISLGCRVTLAGVIGEDDAGRSLSRLLAGAGVEASLQAHPGFPTITKLRVLSRNQQLMRLDFEESAKELDSGGLLGRVRRALGSASVLVLSDYAKGTLRDVEGLIAAGRDAGVPVLVDPKGTDFERYRGASVLTPNQAEFEAVAGAWETEGEFEELAGRMLRDLGLDALLITRSERGMSLFQTDAEPVHLQAHAREVFDVTGAGDTVIAALAAAIGAGATVADAAGVANLAAGIVVGKLGAASVTPEELDRALHRQGIGGQGVLSRDALLEQVAQAKGRGERLVMTNGCFDLLHAGHVGYLEEAKRLGDRLIVAVNDDASVTRLKGEGRPVTPLEDRMAVLAGLAAVDWVVPFSEDTPEGLIAAVSPEVLVKGGDYRPEDIAGAEHVLANGGEVRVLPYQPGRSTSEILNRLATDTD